MASQWFICKNDSERLGPYTPQQLREMAQNGQLLPDDRVWRDGMTKPALARKVQGLFQPANPLPVAPPPLVRTVPQTASQREVDASVVSLK